MQSPHVVDGLEPCTSSWSFCCYVNGLVHLTSKRATAVANMSCCTVCVFSAGQARLLYSRRAGCGLTQPYNLPGERFCWPHSYICTSFLPRIERNLVGPYQDLQCHWTYSNIGTDVH